ncbi:hypothetical protein FT663_03429 [Candidozyma haemuli var. vulneris]|uniref:FAM86 N-terminal domain-containing protein n=1 Tax=Candidozyma haemuli TaxID=45357 RepID=A0A2V1AZI7_9ASCO|nr:hypothetical protein CXQ85_002964 [[Candida] haemuloni]KAF3989858.1 hypothetical protein FT663_03429 [[Candida] haemuloni var. vulneris]KAF3991398.1 hypothetical protein FT662_01753 [[Candida] haemuloni var. vulneris]PVH23234.1 hypothetical protein CXQ85_002964 [[Candida] haemuloni]
MPSIIAALRSRALIKEIFADSELLKTASQSQVMAVVDEIAERNPYYTRTFLSEYVDWLERETEGEDEEGGGEDTDGAVSGDVDGAVDLVAEGLEGPGKSIEEEKKREESEEKKEESKERSPGGEDEEEEDLSTEEYGTVAGIDPEEDPVVAAKSSGNQPETGGHGSESRDRASSNLQSALPTSDTDPYELLCSLLSSRPLPPTAPDLLQYPIDESSNWVSIRETPRVISGQGTTGARTWNAALLLAFVLNTDGRFKGEFDGSTVLELGAGTGLVGAALAKKWQQHNLKKIIITDGDEGVVEKLPLTLETNDIEKHNIECAQFLWGKTVPPENVDIVLGADIIYDPSVLDVLLDTLGDFFAQGARYAVIARSDRNPETTKDWERKSDERFDREVIRVEDPTVSTLPCWFHSGANDITVEIVRKKRV